MSEQKHFQLKDTWSIIKETFQDWQSSEPWRLGAIVAYYAIIALPGLLVIIITVASFFFESEGVRREVEGQLQEVIGPSAAANVSFMIEEATRAEDVTIANIFGIVTLLFGASGLFFHLQRSINDIYGVKSPKNIKKVAIDRALSFGIIIALGFLLLVSLLLTSLLGILRNWLLTFLPQEIVYLFEALNWVLGLFIVGVIFAFVFKYLPDVRVDWKPVLVGTSVTSILYIISEYIIGFYFQESDEGAVYGAAGFIILFMFWITFASLILFFGAELVKVYAKRYGYRIEPGKYGDWKNK
jgi:membrane protein